MGNEEHRDSLAHSHHLSPYTLFIIDKITDCDQIKIDNFKKTPPRSSIMRHIPLTARQKRENRRPPPQ
jgi:hypothetical protein